MTDTYLDELEEYRDDLIDKGNKELDSVTDTKAYKKWIKIRENILEKIPDQWDLFDHWSLKFGSIVEAFEAERKAYEDFVKSEECKNFKLIFDKVTKLENKIEKILKEEEEQ
jgi:hypothetical protein